MTRTKHTAIIAFLLVTAFTFLQATTAWAVPLRPAGPSPSATATLTPADLHLRLATDQPHYRAGAVATVTVTLANRGPGAYRYTSHHGGLLPITVTVTGPDGRRVMLPPAGPGGHHALPVLSRGHLEPGAQLHLTYAWDTSGSAPGAYAVTVTLPPDEAATPAGPGYRAGLWTRIIW